MCVHTVCVCAYCVCVCALCGGVHTVCVCAYCVCVCVLCVCVHTVCVCAYCVCVCALCVCVRTVLCGRVRDVSVTVLIQVCGYRINSPLEMSVSLKQIRAVRGIVLLHQKHGLYRNT